MTSPDQLRAELERLEAQLDDALHLYAEVEEGLNKELKVADPAERVAILARRADIEQTLGIEALVEAIDVVRACLRGEG